MQTYRAYKTGLWSVIGLCILTAGGILATTVGLCEPYVTRPSAFQAVPAIIGAILAGIASGLGIRVVVDWLWEAVGQQLAGLRLRMLSSGFDPTRRGIRDDDRSAGSTVNPKRSLETRHGSSPHRRPRLTTATGGPTENEPGGRHPSIFRIAAPFVSHFQAR